MDLTMYWEILEDGTRILGKERFRTNPLCMFYERELIDIGPSDI